MKKFVATTFNLDNEIFVIHIAFLTSFNLEMKVYPFIRSQIAFLVVTKTSIVVLSEYAYYANVFLQSLQLSFEINNYSINLINDQQLSPRSIYSLKLVKLRTLKI